MHAGLRHVIAAFLLLLLGIAAGACDNGNPTPTRVVAQTPRPALTGTATAESRGPTPAITGTLSIEEQEPVDEEAEPRPAWTATPSPIP